MSPAKVRAAPMRPSVPIVSATECMALPRRLMDDRIAAPSRRGRLLGHAFFLEELVAILRRLAGVLDGVAPQPLGPGRCDQRALVGVEIRELQTRAGPPLQF